MKVRLGFVSNSSSSSFVMAVTKEAYEQLAKECDPFTLAVLRALDPVETTAFGKEVLVFSEVCEEGGEGAFYDLSIDYDGELPKPNYPDEHESDEEFFEDTLAAEAFDRYVKRATEEFENEVFIHNTNM